MNKSKLFFYPILIFILSVVALVLSLILYIHWYMEASTGLKAVMLRFDLDPSQVLEPQTWVVIMVLSILVGIILLGILTIFVYTQKTAQLYRLQHNFINNFTHELKTPVTSLKLYLETFLKHELSREDRHKYIRYMIQDASHLSHNINRILNLARIESKNYTGEFSIADIEQVVKEFLKNNNHLFQNCEININNPSGRSFSYRIDFSLFEMLLMNLLTNAVKYNTSERPRIDITFEPKQRELHIHFEDNGIGFDKKETKKIFRKFYQAGQSDNMSAKGSGLGLHLVQNIARIHKGKVIAESKGMGKGSVFTLILPYRF